MEDAGPQQWPGKGGTAGLKGRQAGPVAPGPNAASAVPGQTCRAHLGLDLARRLGTQQHRAGLHGRLGEPPLQQVGRPAAAARGGAAARLAAALAPLGVLRAEGGGAQDSVAWVTAPAPAIDGKRRSYLECDRDWRP